MASRPQGISGKIQLASTSPGAGDPSLLPENAAKHPQQCTVDPEGISMDGVFARCFGGNSSETQALSQVYSGLIPLYLKAQETNLS